MLAIWAGLLAGALHVVTGPDHLAALAPLAVHHPRQALRTGAAWGLGHGLGVVLLGALGVLLRETINISLISAFSELLVGVILIAVGAWAIRAALRVTVHSHPHDHDEDHHHDHHHIHVGANHHEGADAHRGHTHAALGVGMLHGAAGVGHLLGVVPSLALPPLDAALYLTAYLIAAVAAMAGVGLLLGRVALLGRARLLRSLMVGCGGLSLGIGALWLYTSWAGLGQHAS